MTEFLWTLFFVGIGWMSGEWFALGMNARNNGDHEQAQDEFVKAAIAIFATICLTLWRHLDA